MKTDFHNKDFEMEVEVNSEMAYFIGIADETILVFKIINIKIFSIRSSYEFHLFGRIKI